MRECKNFPDVQCERSCFTTGKCAESVRRVEAEEASQRAAAAQPPPQLNHEPAIQDLVIADIEARKQAGILKYGTVLQAFNGRDALMDAYQEAVDQTLYLRQAYEEAVRQMLNIRQMLEDRRARAPAVPDPA